VPIRIYALAKELNLDSKILVDVCNKVGITGKGSALASLSDEEATKVKAFLSGAKGKKPGTVAATAGRPGASAKRLGAAAQPLRREDYIAPTGTGAGKVPVLKAKVTKPGKPAQVKKHEGEEKPPAAKPPEKTAPAIKLAPLPAGADTAKPGKPKEPVPQKPDIKLPPDAIRSGKAGTTPLSEHLRKHEQKKRAAVKKVSPRQRAPSGEPPPVEPAAPGRERPRRAGREAATAREAGAPTLGGREHRQLKRKRVATARRRKADQDDESQAPTRRRTRIKRTGTNTAAPRKSNVVVQLPCTVRSFS
jgi:translation initiation factor IF-2